MKFRCSACNFEFTERIPKHCKKSCKVKGDRFVCSECGFEAPIPKHCSKSCEIVE